MISKAGAPPAITFASLTALLFLAGIDGFQWLEPLRELGARPFFLVFIVGVGVLGVQRRLRVSAMSLTAFTLLCLPSLTGFLVLGSGLPPFGDKTPPAQFAAQGALFVIGFSPFFLRLRQRLDEQLLARAVATALAFHLAFITVDLAALLLDGPRPFANIFTASERPFPTGMFSEPSYFAAYVGVMLPVCLYRARPWIVLAVSLAAGAAFFGGGVRSFFVIYGAGLAAMMLLRWGWNWTTAAALLAAVAAVAAISVQLNLASVEENLSSAYRLGNTISYLRHAVEHDWLLGVGFGASHFLYPSLDHPAFLFLSNEYQNMLSGDGFRVPVFNLWVRLFVELGILPTCIFLGCIFRAFLSARTPPVPKILMTGAFSLTLSTDSYIYGVFTFALFVLCSVTWVGNGCAAKASARRSRIRSTNGSAVLSPR